LCVVGWVPVMIIEDNSVCSSQVYAQTTRAGTKQENENIGPTPTSMTGQLLRL
jgi:hypothetical protein